MAPDLVGSAGMLIDMGSGSDELSALILAGPNGSGKTTFARRLLSASASALEFINADLIAAEISPGAPERAAMQAGRQMLSAIQERVIAKRSFAVETTLADRAYARMIPRWQAAGFRVKLWFLELPSAEVAIARVAERVRQGGHYIPDAVVRRRFTAGRSNFDELYKNLVDGWALYENSGTAPRLLDSSSHE